MWVAQKTHIVRTNKKKEGVSWNKEKQTWRMGKAKNRQLWTNAKKKFFEKTYFLNGPKPEICLETFPFIII